MSEREIKVGSKWKNVHGEVTVTEAVPHRVTFTGADGDGKEWPWSVIAFRLTHAWVSDPVEAPKVKLGDWVECIYRSGKTEVGSVSGGYIFFRDGGQIPASIATIVDPPALHAALATLVHTVNAQMNADTKDALYLIAYAAREVARLYENGER